MNPEPDELQEILEDTLEEILYDLDLQILDQQVEELYE